jgi:feruloyl esterase
VILDRYDTADGAADGLIWDPTVIELDRKALGFLNDAQFRSLQIIQDGIDAGKGAYYPGFWMSNPSGFTSFLFGMKRPPWGPGDRAPAVPAGWVVAETGSKAVRGADFNFVTDFDFDDPDQLLEDRRLNTAKGRETFSPEQLKGLQKGGGKLILWSGSADQAVPPANLVDFTRKADKVFGEKERSRFIRTFYAPGMFHCIGGVGHPTNVPDVMLEAAAKWVETDKAPDFVVANADPKASLFTELVGANNSPDSAASEARLKAMQAAMAKMEPRSYLLCPWPQRSVFKGGVANPDKLDVRDANNWRCEG